MLRSGCCDRLAGLLPMRDITSCSRVIVSLDMVVCTLGGSCLAAAPSVVRVLGGSCSSASQLFLENLTPLRTRQGSRWGFYLLWHTLAVSRPRPSPCCFLHHPVAPLRSFTSPACPYRWEGRAAVVCSQIAAHGESPSSAIPVASRGLKP